MLRERINLARGRDPPRLDRSSGRCGSVLCILLLFGCSFLLGCDGRSNGTPDVHGIVAGVRTGADLRQADHAYSRRSDSVEDHAADQGDLYIGHGGDPWSASSSHNYEQDTYLRASSPAINNTKAHQSAVTREMSHARFKRGVIHLYNMVVCATGCNPLAYKGYGCYCGFLGSGYVIDGIDQCCKMHDWCYDATECPMFSEYFIPYYWRCYHGHKPVCAVEHGEWGGSGSCSQRLCECDRSLAECLRRYPCPTTKAVCTSSLWRLVQNLFMAI